MAGLEGARGGGKEVGGGGCSVGGSDGGSSGVGGVAARPAAVYFVVELQLRLNLEPGPGFEPPPGLG